MDKDKQGSKKSHKTFKVGHGIKAVLLEYKNGEIKEENGLCSCLSLSRISIIYAGR